MWFSSSSRVGLALLSIAAGLFMGLLDLSIVTIAVPEIARDLDASFVQQSWVVNAYTLATAAMILPAGKLADTIGRKRVFAGGMVLFTAASLLCGLAPNIETLIAFRALQGIGGAAMVTVSLAILTYTLPANRQELGFALWGATGGLALAAGPSLGGVLTEFASWRWIFIVNLPIAAVALPLLVLNVEERRGDSTGLRQDWIGLVTVVGGLTALSLGLLQGQQWGWDSARIIGLLGGSVLLFAAFFINESRVESPMVPLHYFRIPRFAAASALWFGAMFAFISIFFFLPIYLQVVKDYSMLEASLALSPGPFTAFLVAPISGLISRRRGPVGPAFVGVGIVIAGALINSQISGDWSYLQLVAIAAFTGVGFGLASPALTQMAMGAIAPQDAGIGAGIFNTVRQIGAVMGVSALGAILQARMVDSFEGSLASSAIPPGVQPAVADQFARSAAQRGGLDSLPAPPELIAEIQRLASLGLVDGLQVVFLVAGLVCLLALATGAVLLGRSKTAAEAPTVAAVHAGES
jgi:EmrB/QacA subfamily drug resistance transporter